MSEDKEVKQWKEKLFYQSEERVRSDRRRTDR